jgi:tetratricopeptide (TPR) repeat protein
MPAALRREARSRYTAPVPPAHAPTRRARGAARAILAVTLAASGPSVPAAGQATLGPDAEAWPERVEALLHGGRYADALAALDEARAPGSIDPLARPATRGATEGGGLSPATLRLLAALLTASWGPAASIDAQALSPADASTYWYVKGVIEARAAWPGGTPARLAAARGAAGHLEQLSKASGTLNRSEVRRSAVLAAMAGAQEEREEMTLLLTHARFLDAQLRGVGVPEETVLPLDELAGDLWLLVHRYADALEHYRAATAAHPRRTRAWLGRARAARDAGHEAEAREAAARVLAAWERADAGADRNEMLELVGRGTAAR